MLDPVHKRMKCTCIIFVSTLEKMLWMRGPGGNLRLSAAQIGQISEKLISIRRNVPRDFARKPRPLGEIDRWKATEFRQFL